MVPTPTSLPTATPATEVNSSGADEPAAIKVAPATSSDRSSFSEMASKEGTKKSSHMRASPGVVHGVRGREREGQELGQWVSHVPGTGGTNQEYCKDSCD